MHSLLRNVADGLRGEVRVDTGFAYCHNGAGGMCESCPVERNRNACQLSEDEHLERWIVWHTRGICEDPYKWAYRAFYDIRSCNNAGMFVFFEVVYRLVLENGDNEDLVSALPYLEEVLTCWGSWLRRFAGEARQRHIDHPGNKDYKDASETCDAILALAAAAGRPEPVYIEPQMVDGVCMNPTSGRPTTEWPRPLGRHVNVAQGKGIVKT